MGERAREMEPGAGDTAFCLTNLWRFSGVAARLPPPVAPLKSAVGAVGAVGATRLDRERWEEEEIRRQLEEQREAIVHRARLRETDVQYNTLHC